MKELFQPLLWKTYLNGQKEIEPGFLFHKASAERFYFKQKNCTQVEHKEQAMLTFNGKLNLKTEFCVEYFVIFLMIIDYMQNLNFVQSYKCNILAIAMQNIENRPLTFLHKQRGISEQISLFIHQLSI